MAVVYEPSLHTDNNAQLIVTINLTYKPILCWLLWIVSTTFSCSLHFHVRVVCRWSSRRSLLTVLWSKRWKLTAVNSCKHLSVKTELHFLVTALFPPVCLIHQSDYSRGVEAGDDVNKYEETWKLFSELKELTYTVSESAFLFFYFFFYFFFFGS